MNRRGFIGAIAKGAAALGLIGAGVKVPEVVIQKTFEQDHLYVTGPNETWHYVTIKPNSLGDWETITYTGNGEDERALRLGR